MKERTVFCDQKQSRGLVTATHKFHNSKVDELIKDNGYPSKGNLCQLCYFTGLHYWYSSILEGLCKMRSSHIDKHLWTFEALTFSNSCYTEDEGEEQHSNKTVDKCQLDKLTVWQLTKYELSIITQKWSISPWNTITKLHLLEGGRNQNLKFQ